MSSTEIINKYLGVDLGQQNDSTAMVVLDHVVARDDEYLSEDDQEFRITWIERIKLGVSYPEQVKIIADRKRKLGEVTLVVDCTGVGLPVYDMLKEEQLDPVGIWITGGDQVHHDEGDETKYRVPKRDLVTAIQVRQQRHQLFVHPKLAERQAFERELANFKYKINLNTAHDSYGAWRDGHDDMTLACACAVWLAAYRPKPEDQRVGSFTMFGVSHNHPYNDGGAIPYDQRTNNYRRITRR